MLSYPQTWAAGALLAILTVGFVTRYDPSAVMMLALGVVVVLAVAGWPLAMSVTGTLSARQFAVRDDGDADPCTDPDATFSLQISPMCYTE